MWGHNECCYRFRFHASFTLYLHNSYENCWFGMRSMTRNSSWWMLPEKNGILYRKITAKTLIIIMNYFTTWIILAGICQQEENSLLLLFSERKANKPDIILRSIWVNSQFKKWNNGMCSWKWKKNKFNLKNRVFSGFIIWNNIYCALLLSAII